MTTTPPQTAAITMIEAHRRRSSKRQTIVLIVIVVVLGILFWTTEGKSFIQWISQAPSKSALLAQLALISTVALPVLGMFGFVAYVLFGRVWRRNAAAVVMSAVQGGTLLRGNTFLSSGHQLFVPDRDAVTIEARGNAPGVSERITSYNVAVACSQGTQSFQVNLAAASIDVTPLVRHLTHRGCKVTVDPFLPRPWESDPSLLYAQQPGMSGS